MAQNDMPPEYEEYIKKLNAFGDDILPNVIAETINTVATFAHIQTIRDARKKMTMRNKYTERSIGYYKAKPRTDISKINAVSGSISDYMDEQDQGGYRLPKQGGKAPVTTLYARGGNPAKRKSERFKLGQDIEGSPELKKKIFIGRPKGGGKNADKPVGIYVRATKKKIRMTHNLESASVSIAANNWHTDAVNLVYTAENFASEFIRQAKQELARLGAT